MQGFGQLESLRDLHMERCRNLLSLPAGFCELSNLTQLTLGDSYGGCDKLEFLPERFGQLRRLSKLDLTGCTQLRALPEGISPRYLPPPHLSLRSC